MGTEALDELKTFEGRKLFGGGAGTQSRPDNLKSDDIVEVIFGVSEGDIEGLSNGARSFYIGETPLVAADGTQNFSNFQLQVWKGQPLGVDIKAKLGGFASSVNVGVNLETNTPVVRQGNQTKINYIDLRIVVNRLVIANSKGEGDHEVKFKIEYKATSSPTWLPAYVSPGGVSTQTVGDGTVPIEEHLTSEYYTAEGRSHAGSVKTQMAAFDNTTYWQNDAPAGSTGSIWFEKDAQHRPRIWNGSAWVDPPGLFQDTGTAPNHWRWTDASYGIRRAYYGNDTAVPPSLTQSDFWLKTFGVTTGDAEIYVYNGVSFQTSQSWKGTTSLADGVVALRGKTTSPFVKELRINVTEIDDTYDVRVTKLTEVNTTEKFADITWESFQQIKAKAFNFPNLAVAQLVARASDQFSSLPDFTGIYKGRIINIPSNYDPITHTYTGVWDGLFVRAWSNNPAWVAWDLIHNDRYGLNAYYPVVGDKWAFYAFARHCDQHGFTFNGTIYEPKPAIEIIQYVCGLAGGNFIDDGEGYATILIDDADSPATHLFTPENVVDGLFTYSMTDISTRSNDITVSFLNPQLNYQEDRRRVYDQTHINKYGRIPENFEAIGCRSDLEAIRRGRYQLIGATTETIMVSFKTNRHGLYLAPYNIILIADDTSGFGLHGRITGQPTDKAVTLRDPIYLEPGFAYTATFQRIGDDGKFETFTRNVLSPAGSQMTLLFDNPLPPLAEECVFSLSSTNPSTGAPVAYRITSIDMAEDDPDNVTINAIIVNRNKWAYVDGAVGIDNTPTTTPGVNVAMPPTNIRITPRYFGNQLDLFVEWDPPSSVDARKYRVYVQQEMGTMGLYTEAPSTSTTISNVSKGMYRIGISSVTIGGVESIKTVVEFNVSGVERPIANPANLKLFDEPSPTIFESSNPKFTWDVSTDPLVTAYEITLKNSTTGIAFRGPIRIEHPINEWTYDYAYIATDGRPRIFRVDLVAVDTFGNKSAASTLTVENPKPAAPTLTFAYGPATCTVNAPLPSDRDFGGMKVWIRPTPLENLTSIGPDYDGPNNSYTFRLDDGVTRYIRVAYYDTYKPTDYNVSGEYTVVGTGVTWEMFDPVIRDIEERTQDALDRAQQSLNDLAGMVQNLDAGNLLDKETVQRRYESLGTSAEARLLETYTVIQNNIAAEASARQSLQALINDPTTGLPATRADFTEFSTTQANINGSLSAHIEQVKAMAVDASTQATATATSLDGVRARTDVVENGITATVERVNSLEARINNAAGTVQALAQVLSSYEATVKQIGDQFTAYARRVEGVEVSAYGVSAAGRLVSTATVDGSGATATVDLGVKIAGTGFAPIYGGISFTVGSYIGGVYGVYGVLRATSILVQDTSGNTYAAFNGSDGTLHVDRIKAKSINSVKGDIADLSVQTLMVGNNAITVPQYFEQASPLGMTTSNQIVHEVSYWVPGIPVNETPTIMVHAHGIFSYAGAAQIIGLITIQEVFYTAGVISGYGTELTIGDYYSGTADLLGIVNLPCAYTLSGTTAVNRNFIIRHKARKSGSGTVTCDRQKLLVMGVKR